MRQQVISRSNWARLMTFLVIVAVVGCAGQPPAPTQPSASSPPPDATSLPTDVAASPTEPSVEPAPTSPEGQDSNILYQEDFTNPATGWAKAEFGGYFIGYHEPESYHIEIQTAHLAAPVVSIPNSPDGTSPVYTDATIELAVQTVSGKTSTEGDYRYGLAFRQTGGNYYAFTISPTNKKWEVFKNAAGQITPLTDGTEESIQGLDVDDVLRVDASGSNFAFYINDKQVGQVTDPDYPEGTVGLYAENLQNVTTHIHFNTLTISELKLNMMCSVPGTVYVRTGPGQKYAQVDVLSAGDVVQATGISPNQWVQIVLEGSNEPGWVSYNFDGGQLSCTPSIDVFPIINP